MASAFLKDKAKVLGYLGDRVRHLAKIFAHALEEGQEEAALREMVELSTLLNLLALVIDRDNSVQQVGDDYVVDVDSAQDDLPF